VTGQLPVVGPAVALAVWLPAAYAQEAAPRVELSADSVEMAEVFDVVVQVDVPAGSAVYFPDTVAATPYVESHEPVTWRAERAGTGATLTLRYAVIPFGTGRVQVPGVDVVVAPVASAEGEEGDDIPGGSRVGVWDDVPGASSVIRRHRSEDAEVWVAPVQTDEELASGAMPRPPDDVMGFGWSWPNVLLLGLFTSTLAAVGTTTTKEWIARRRAVVPVPTTAGTPEAARLAALGEIDRLLAAHARTIEDEMSLYRASSDAVRRYVEQLDAGWGPELTSTELMNRFRRVRAPSDTPARELSTAERVKFGRLRTGRDGVRSHLEALRAWLSERHEETPA
jgi:hypothetical protein